MPRTGPGLTKVAQEIRTNAKLALEAAAKLLHAQVISELSTPGKGRIYEKYKPRRTHQASAPGDPPAPDTGVLRNSITIGPTETGYRVGTNLQSAPVLEFGSSSMAPRPFMRPAIDKVREQLGPAIVAVLRRKGAR